MSIERKIKRIEKNLPNVNFEGGKAIFSYEKTFSLIERMNELNIPGSSFSIIDNFDRIVKRYYGVRDVKSNVKVDEQTLFEAGSTSKVITATLALYLVENGIIQLEKDVNTYLKNWKIPSKKDVKHKVTLKQLLTHTAGINRPDSMFSVENGKRPSILQVLKGETPAINDPVKIEFIPGKDHVYSNFGFIIIEKIIEDVSGKKFSDFAKETVFDPLKMKDSFFGYPNEKTKKRMISPHNEKGEPQETGLHPSIFGNGGLITTVNDLSIFMLELMNSYNGASNKILSKETTRTMLSSIVPLDPSKYFGFTGQGLGVFLIEKDNSLFLVHPGTNYPGAVCMFIGSPTLGKGFVAMSNGIQAELLHLQLLSAVAKEYEWPIYS